jgi:tRNA A-37 threonylcarbamoyl transferase component Bud32
MHTNKRKRPNHYYTRKKRCKKGGVAIRNSLSPDTAFAHFLENSSFTYFDRGFFGVLVLATLKKGVESNYVSVRLSSSEPVVRTLLIKLIKLEKPTDPRIKVVTPDDVKREISIQQDIYHTTLSDNDTLLEPICPCIVHSSTYMERDDKERLHSVIGVSDNRINDVFSGESLAYIAMEFMEEYVPLHTLEQSPKYNTYKQMSLHMLDKMHACGYLHGDYTGNTMVHETYNYYNFQQMGRAIIIDFGLSTYIHKRDRLKMMKYDSNISNPDVFTMFDKLDELHNGVQAIGIQSIETRLRMKITDIIKMFVFYKGGMTPRKQKESFKKDIAVSFNWQVDFNVDNIVPYDGKTNPPIESFAGLNYIAEKQKTDPKFFEKCIAAQFNHLIIPEQ